MNPRTILAAMGALQITPELSMRVIEPKRSATAVARTKEAIRTKWAGNEGRINKAHAFIKRAQKSDARRRQEKASRKANRRRGR